MIGNLLGSRYEIVSQLGGGGMALVYKARDTLLNRRVTVKVLRPEFTCDEEFVARFRREAQAVAKLSHPNIVSVYDVGQEGDTHYIVMEYVEGRNLKQVINELGRLPLTQAADIARQICEGVQDAHENGIVHRDIKPHNILVTETGKVKVTDFGIAQMMSSVTVTNSGTIVGSVHYFSPEQAKGNTTGAKSDIYSAGVVLYEMVTGRVPFEGETPIAIALKHINSEPVPPGKLNPQVTPELERIILRAMKKDLTMRYLSAGDMARDLRRLINGETGDENTAIGRDEFATRVMNGPVVITKGQGDDQERPYRRKKRKIRSWVILVPVILLGLLAGAGYYWLNGFLNVPEVEVPDVENMLQSEAQKTLRDNGLDSELADMVHDPEVDSGYIIKQVPQAGEKVKQNTKVQLTVSLGAEFLEVPNVVRKEKAAAEIEIENNGFKPSSSEEYSEDVPAGTVASQTPEGGEQARAGSTVKMVISKGPEPRPTTVPKIVGLSLKEAGAKLEEAKLRLSSDITQDESTEFRSGYVMAQDPAPDTELQEGTEVRVVLSLGPGPEEKTARVRVEFPNDGLVHKVKIVVIDVVGTRTVYGPQEHNPGEVISPLINYFNKGKIQVFIDDFERPWREELVD